MNDFKIFNLAGPPTDDKDAVNKQYVDEAIPIRGIILWSGHMGAVPKRWALCDGTNGTPNLIDRFVMGSTLANTDHTGGSPDSHLNDHTHDATHNHTATSSYAGKHTHSMNHGHSGGTARQSDHVHLTGGGMFHTMLDTTGAFNMGMMQWYTNHSTAPDGGHSHAVGIPYSNFTTSESPAHKHNITVNTKTFRTGTTGDGSNKGENNPAFYTLAYIQRIS